MNLGSTAVSLGGITFGTIIVVLVTLRWWKKGGENGEDAEGEGDGIGYAYLVWGIGGNSPDVTRANPVVLTDGGYMIFAIWTAVMIGLYLWSRKLPRLQTALGILAGILLGLSQGIAGMAAVPLASAVNVAGSWYAGVVQ
ncbi:hypothetical protein [Streptomyces griseolus]|uniref:hypothetical protein n=1 Tax=Streptomyces griseolus TaxID=1909 RepID=UPI0022430CD2|nr:hypothetical protein [Streptomyces griseolus]MCW8221208.1 hypothetical protein [Streptomyces griseolus]